MKNTIPTNSIFSYFPIYMVIFIFMIMGTSANGQVSQQWASRYNGPGTNLDVCYSITTDASGNVYVTGASMSYTAGIGPQYDIATLKFNSAGVQQWVQRYSGSGNSDDIAYAIAVDASGNVYVAGSSKSSYASGSENYVILKYSSAGSLLWSRFYNGPGSNSDIAYSIAIDAAGDVSVTGSSTGSGTNLDYATVKYNSAGTLQWSQRYNGPGNNRDEASTIKVDAAGNIYVTGGSRNGSVSGTEDYATIKYNSAGVQQWVQRYNGTGNAWDEANSIAVDASGNVYVTGASIGSATDYDYATVKYNSAGTQQWVQRYNGPANSWDEANSISVDASGNVYITGYSIGSGTDFDYATIKYNSAGVQQWLQRYNGPAGTVDQAVSIAVDASGNVYASGWSVGSGTGYDYAVLKYNSAGVQQWAQRYNGPANSGDYGMAMAVDASGNIYFAGYSEGNGTSSDYGIIKYNTSGVQQWLQRYNGPVVSEEHSSAMTVDASGNVYVTGSSIGAGTDYDYVTVKYNSAGAEQWVQRYNGPGNSLDEASAIAVDASGNVFVTGYSSQGIPANYEYATVKYNSAGVQQWVQRYNGTGNGGDFAYSLALDASGNVYVTGASMGTGSDYDYATIKYNTAGAQQWIQIYNGPGNNLDWASSIAADAAGNIYVTGRSTGTGTGEDYATIKYSASGVQQWVQRYNGTGNSTDEANSVKADASGNVYVTGWSYGTGSGSDYATIKYNSAGVQQWAQRYNGPGNNIDEASSIGIDGSGNVFVTGFSEGSGSGNDYATIKYNSAGVQQWTQRYNGTANNDDEASSIAIDGTGSIYVTGMSTGSGTGFDYTTIKYNSAGAQQWLQNYNGTANASDKASSITIDAAGKVYVTGQSDGSGTGTDFATVKYSQVVGIEPASSEIPDKFSLSQNYPNPFNPSTHIKISVAHSGLVSMKIYDIQGKEVAVLLNEELNPGTFELEWNASDYPSGVYLYKLTSADYSETRKMILTK